MHKDRWIWMPHAGHLIVGHECRFHLNTYVGGYLVSTVGEWWPDAEVRRIHSRIRDPRWEVANRSKQGDEWDAVYLQRFGYMEIGYARRYETMVFEAAPESDSQLLCCPWRQKTGSNVDFAAYDTAVEAYHGHLALCEKWSKEAA